MTKNKGNDFIDFPSFYFLCAIAFQSNYEKFTHKSSFLLFTPGCFVQCSTFVFSFFLENIFFFPRTKRIESVYAIHRWPWKKYSFVSTLVDLGSYSWPKPPHKSKTFSEIIWSLNNLERISDGKRFWFWGTGENELASFEDIINPL